MHVYLSTKIFDDKKLKQKRTEENKNSYNNIMANRMKYDTKLDVLNTLTFQNNRKSETSTD